MAEVKTKTPLGYLDRYNLVRTQMGFTPALCFAIAYPTEHLPSTSFLHDRLSALQGIWPHLYTEIVDESTNTPSWSPRSRPWTGDQLVQTLPVSPEDDLESIIQKEQERSTKSISPSGPFLQITRYTSSESNLAYIGISIAHELADGMGSLRLINIILDKSLDISTLEPESSPPVRLEETTNLKPPTLTMLGIVFQKLLLPKLPTLIQSYFPQPEKTWPEVIHTPPKECPNGLSLLALPSSLLDRLSSIRDTQAPGTSIHSIILTAYTISLMSIVNTPSATFSVGTPRNERKRDIHPFCLGNYVSSLHTDFNSSLLYGQDFWTIAKSTGQHLKSPKTIQGGLETIGLLAYVPNSPNTTGPTAWEKFWSDEANKQNPYDKSWSLSNLGQTEIPEGATDMAWSQPSGVWGVAISVSMLRHGGGVRMGTTWREGSAIRGEEIKRVEERFKVILNRVAEGWEGKLADLMKV